MLKAYIKSKIVLTSLLLLFSTVFSSEINIKEIQEILNNQDPLVKGIIQNLQIAPFNNNLISFEVTYDNEPTVKLFLFNKETKNYFQVESSNFSGDSKGKKKYYLKDKGLQWHPYKNWFVFGGNAFSNREQIYVCRVVVPELINNFAVNGYRVRLNEDSKEEKSYLVDPTFDTTGDNLLFSRRVVHRDKKIKYNKSYNITIINDFFKYRDDKFKNVNFKTVIDKKYHQFKPVCSPTDKDLVAYISYKNQEKKGEDYYVEYSLNVINLSNSEIVTVDNMDGYRDYSFKWSNTGVNLFYYKALSLLRTPQNFIDDKINQVNLQFAKITKTGNKLAVYLQTNPKTDVLLDDVKPWENSITFINENNILVTKYDPYPSTFIVDISMWRNSEKKYSQKVQYNNEFDTDNPVLIGSEMLFISTTYLKNRTVVAINTAEIELKLSGGEAQDILAIKAVMDTEGSNDSQGGDEETFEEDESYDDNETSDIPVVDTTKAKNNDKIAEIENEISKLSLDITKLDNQISSENINKENYENEVKSFIKETNDLLDTKNSYLEKINEFRTKQTEKLQNERLISEKQSELNKLVNDKLRMQNESLTLENLILTEKNTLNNLEEKLKGNVAEITKINSSVSNLKIEQAKTLQVENKLESFELQLKDIQVKNSNIKTEIDQYTKELTDSQNLLKDLEKQLSEKNAGKKSLIASVEKLRSDKLLTLEKDLASQIKVKESDLSTNNKNLSNIETEISKLSEDIEIENKNITDSRNKITKMNEEKISLLSNINDLKSKKATSEKEIIVKKDEPKKEEVIKEKTPEVEDEYSDEDDYGDDDSIDEDIFEDVQTPSVNRRGRR